MKIIFRSFVFFAVTFFSVNASAFYPDHSAAYRNGGVYWVDIPNNLSSTLYCRDMNEFYSNVYIFPGNFLPVRQDGAWDCWY